MINVNLKTTVNTTSDELWRIVSDFNGLSKFMEAVTAGSVDGEGIGAIRTLTLPDGAQIHERLEEFDDSKMKLVYSILDGPLPVEAYKSTMQVTDLGNGKSELMWSSIFNPKGASEKESKEAIEGIYNMGFEGILKIFG